MDIEIDGKLAHVPDGGTIMDAAQQVGAYIPHFCYHKKLSIAANCRMCLVQVEKAPKPLPACATPVTNGMKVFTHSDLAVKAQKGVMEFLLINHPLDCPICDQGGECQLQDLAVGYGGGASRYQESKRVVMYKDVGPLISMQEMTRCIHCTRCVRFGQEIAGVMELGMANRNMHSEIVTFLGRSVDSELSGNMIDLCPVGALTSKPFRYSARSWELARRRSISPHDSLGTNLTLQIKNNVVMRALPRENEDVNECWISDKDRFSYEALNSPARLGKPLIRIDGALREVEWNVALDYVAHALRDIARQHGGESIAALGSPHATLEELFLLQKLTRGLGSGNVDFRPRRRDFSTDGKRLGVPWLGMKLAEISQLDAALVVGSFLRKDHPLFAQRLRQLARKWGKVSLVSVSADDPLLPLHARMAVSPADLPVALAAVVKAAAEQQGKPLPAGVESVTTCAASQAIARSLIEGEKSAIFLGNAAEQSPYAGQLHALANALAELTGASCGFIGEAANSVGGHLAQAVPTSLNAYEMFARPRKAYILLGVEPELDCHDPQMATSALRSADFVVALSAFADGAACDHADALLPIAPFSETSGSFVNTEGRIQSFSGALRPFADARPGWKVLRVLGNLLELPGFAYETSEQVRADITPLAEGFVGGLDNGLRESALSLPGKAGGLQRIADVPIHFADALVRRAPALQKTRDAAAPAARACAATLARLGLSEGATVRVKQAGGEALLALVADATVPPDCIRVAAGHASTATLGEMFGAINVERA
ncbi:MAG TPA: NADH-quinone oxidoreductase subunit NuoG [Accumulibacter sp.]|uniref:NADH-quinone oxidoreductase subunit NuoG n=1 Tax=Accumulibacter sp. TaxID=2053492 RepID=UPI0028787AF2|nr:NADH-quinone oxidoreductase subunit NuoG [Accumulibacter sp.]HNN08700.1 NADH-quinone oxidoreductase subunit NuoG [Azospira sp.]MDS4055946.1 NADH-quinone oxidoreductase subunit NuoG [Accumulibacter sp.]HMV06427.1 NADH-quinone oxidoreductase subunit NuoG [Accumulibacter sp.]HMW63327.1 NADH-quinone oxidoreductase subunit NuoG [Accumulibacter sp.]HMW81249.1 NADH-quinone oxidoreductase subunit NuoG [Accumulibacter sp.]